MGSVAMPNMLSDILLASRDHEVCCWLQVQVPKGAALLSELARMPTSAPPYALTQL